MKKFIFIFIVGFFAGVISMFFVQKNFQEKKKAQYEREMEQLEEKYRKSWWGESDTKPNKPSGKKSKGKDYYREGEREALKQLERGIVDEDKY